MTKDIREILKSVERVRLAPDIPVDILRRAKRRRLWSMVTTTTVAVAVLGTGVMATASMLNGANGRVAPADSPAFCSPDQIGDVTYDIAEPIGTGEGHSGVYFEARITDHDPGCKPAIYVELDDYPALPPDGEGVDADEFRRSSIYIDRGENPCVVTDSVAGDFLYSGRHVIGVGFGCDPEQSWPHSIYKTIPFDGDADANIRRQERLEAIRHSLEAEHRRLSRVLDQLLERREQLKQALNDRASGDSSADVQRRLRLRVTALDERIGQINRQLDRMNERLRAHRRSIGERSNRGSLLP